MAGNIMEWVMDSYNEDYYEISPYENPLNTDPALYTVLRGGMWHFSEDNLCVACRLYDTPYNKLTFIGFRCAQDAEIP